MMDVYVVVVKNSMFGVYKSNIFDATLFTLCLVLGLSSCVLFGDYMGITLTLLITYLILKLYDKGFIEK